MVAGLNAPVIPGTFVVNIGDQFARWTSESSSRLRRSASVGATPDNDRELYQDHILTCTDDIFVSTPHRVLPPTRTRYSIPFFFGSDHDVPLVPPPSCVSAERPNRYAGDEVTAGEYVQRRLAETYS